MKITKYPQSAVLIENNNKRILIDPGSFCYTDNFTADSWGKIDVLLFTHEHADHFVPEAAQTILKNNPAVVIISNSSVCKILSSQNIPCQVIKPDEEKLINGVKIKGMKSIHGELPSGKPKPEVIGFLIDDKIYHPGDTLTPPEIPSAEIIFVPISGTVTMDISQAAAFAKQVHPKITIPIHYDSPKYPVNVADFVAEMAGSPVAALKNGESLTMEDYLQ